MAPHVTATAAAAATISADRGASCKSERERRQERPVERRGDEAGVGCEDNGRRPVRG